MITELESLKFELMLNGSNLSDFGFKESSNGYIFNSMGSYTSLCKTFDSYIINTGIVIIISYILIYFFLWWFLKYGYKKLNSRTLLYFGNLEIIDNRIYMDNWVKARISKFMLGYIVVVVYLTI